MLDLGAPRVLGLFLQMKLHLKLPNSCTRERPMSLSYWDPDSVHDVPPIHYNVQIPFLTQMIRIYKLSVRPLRQTSLINQCCIDVKPLLLE